MSSEKTYIAIDLKSFYASVECVKLGLDPLNTNLVVADESRTDKTICLAVSPPLKARGVPGRPRLFEVNQIVRLLNAERIKNAPGKKFTRESISDSELNADPSLAIGFYIARPRMAEYIKISSDIYSIYMRYVAPEDMHIYSVDEVFIDATPYLKVRKQSAHEFAMEMVRAVLRETGITATAGIGSNMYLCKVAMDIVAKHMPPDSDGVRIAELNDESYRKILWDHRPLRDFWRIGRGISKRLEALGLYTMGDIARFSLYNEDILYKMFGINAELIIDHAWGAEPCTMQDIKKYRPKSNSISSGQVLPKPYDYKSARMIVREMAELLSLDMVEKKLVSEQINLYVRYNGKYGGPVMYANGSVHLGLSTSSSEIIADAAVELFDDIIDRKLYVRGIYITALDTASEDGAKAYDDSEQLDMFTDYRKLEKEKKQLELELQEERKEQRAMLEIKSKFGKNGIFKAADLQEDATTIARNSQIGGHKS